MFDDEGYQMFNMNEKDIKIFKMGSNYRFNAIKVIYSHGGFYFDVNFEILKPLYNLLNNNCHLLVVMKFKI